MNIARLASQFFEIAISKKFISDLRKKSHQYINKLNYIRKEFDSLAIQHPCIDILTTLILSYNQHINELESNGYSLFDYDTRLNNLHKDESKILSTIHKCKCVAQSTLTRRQRHTF